jgi:hypothetical protein
MNSDTAASLTIMVLAGVVLFVLMLLITTAAPAAVCLSKSDARHLWPRAHIFWFRDKQTGNHCWSNRRGPPRNLRIDPVAKSTAHKKIAPAAKAEEIEEMPDVWPRLTEFDMRFVGDKP